MCIARNGKGIQSSFKVLSTMLGVQMEHHIPTFSPVLKDVVVLKRPKRVRRAKLYYLRDRPQRFKKMM